MSGKLSHWPQLSEPANFTFAALAHLKRRSDIIIAAHCTISSESKYSSREYLILSVTNKKHSSWGFMGQTSIQMCFDFFILHSIFLLPARPRFIKIMLTHSFHCWRESSRLTLVVLGNLFRGSPNASTQEADDDGMVCAWWLENCGKSWLAWDQVKVARSSMKS